MAWEWKEIVGALSWNQWCMMWNIPSHAHSYNSCVSAFTSFQGSCNYIKAYHGVGFDSSEPTIPQILGNRYLLGYKSTHKIALPYERGYMFQGWKTTTYDCQIKGCKFKFSSNQKCQKGFVITFTTKGDQIHQTILPSNVKTLEATIHLFA